MTSIALVGNPNSGKSALFNRLTGSQQRVGNWSGVTVEKKVGTCQINLPEKIDVDIIDLPGIYSLLAHQKNSIDEQISTQCLLEESIDGIINIIDASRVERHLFLTLQLLETQVPMVVALNMVDVLDQQHGQTIDAEKLSKQLGCPVIPIQAHKGKGLNQLNKAIAETFLINQPKKQPIENLPWLSRLNPTLLDAIQTISQTIADKPLATWLALRLCEEDQYAQSLLTEEQLKETAKQLKQIDAHLEEDTDILLADARYTFAHTAADLCLSAQKKRRNITEKIDRIVLNKYCGLPIFILMMYAMFFFAINIGGAFQDFFDISSNTLLVNGLAAGLMHLHTPPWLIAILASGIGKGINTTITFIPVIAGMFLFLSFLEDSGYMARAAFVVDRLMQTLGLPGKSFVPMIVGFGCNVPAVMGARTLSRPRDRILSVMMMPFMSCGARLAIFAVFVSAFFKQGGQNIIFLLYFTGIAVAVFTALILRKTLLPGKPEPLLLELPPYHLPQARVLCRHTWQRLKHFIKRASRVIIPVCLMIGVLNTITIHGRFSSADANSDTLLSYVGQKATVVLHPMGIENQNWPATVGLITGVLAKEVVVATLNSLYSDLAHVHGQADQAFSIKAGLMDAVTSIRDNLEALPQALSDPILASAPPHDMNRVAFGEMYKAFGSPQAAFCYLLFVLLYFPCISTLAVMKREVGPKWAYFSLIWSGALAYGLSVFVYQALTFSKHVRASSAWMIGIATVFVFTLILMKAAARRGSHAQPD
jgi:ferrous iron transport protein B